VPRWVRTLPVTFRLAPPGSRPAVRLVPLADCGVEAAGAGEGRELTMRRLGDSGSWRGLADLRGLGGACARLEVRVDGVLAGTVRLSLRR